MTHRETRRILLDGNVVDVVRQGDTLVAHDGREVGVDDAQSTCRPSCRPRSSAST